MKNLFFSILENKSELIKIFHAEEIERIEEDSFDNKFVIFKFPEFYLRVLMHRGDIDFEVSKDRKEWYSLICLLKYLNKKIGERVLFSKEINEFFDDYLENEISKGLLLVNRNFDCLNNFFIINETKKLKKFIENTGKNTLLRWSKKKIH